MTDGYPVVLRIGGRRCVVVGGGAVGVRKVAALLAAGGDVVVVAPEADPALETLADQGALRLVRHPFAPANLDGAFLALAATDDPRVNRAVADAARARGVLVNVADDPAACDFTVPATVRQGDVTLAVSTGGRSPAFARFLRQSLERWLTPERSAALEIAAEVRRELRTRGQQASAEDWQRAIDDAEVARALAAGDRDEARRRLLDRLTADS